MANRIEMAGVFLSFARRSLPLSISRVEASELAIANGAASMPAFKNYAPRSRQVGADLYEPTQPLAASDSSYICHALTPAQRVS
jgi:hypothetical protein